MGLGVSVALACGGGAAPSAGQATPAVERVEEAVDAACAVRGGPRCGPRRYAFPLTGGTLPAGPVPCSNGFCDEDFSGGGLGSVAGAAGGLWIATEGGLLHEQGGRWVTACPPDGFPAVTVVGGTRADDVWLGGAAGATAHWDGARWRTFAAPTAAAIVSVQGDARAAFALDADGGVLGWDGAAWRLEGITATDLAFDGVARAFAVSGGGVLERTAAGWIPVSGLPPDVVPASVAAPAGDDLWIAGAIPSGRFSTAVVLRRVGGAIVDAGFPDPTGRAATRIRAATADDVWVIAGDPRASHGTAYRWDGAAWTTTGVSLFATLQLLAVDGTGYAFESALLRLDGGAADVPFQSPDAYFGAVGARAGELWLGGPGGMWRLEGRAFRVVNARATPLAMAPAGSHTVWMMQYDALQRLDDAGVAAFPYPDPTFRPVALASSGPGAAWVLGTTWNATLLLRWHGAAWTSSTLGVELPTAVWSSPSGEAWVLGNVYSTPVYTTVLQRVTPGGAISRQELPWHDVRTIFGTGPRDVWLSGYQIRDCGCADNYVPTLLHWDGAALTRVAQLAFSRIAGTGPGDLWAIGDTAVGEPDRLWHLERGTWRAVDLGAMPVPQDLAVPRPADVWGISGRHVIHRR